MKTVTYRVPSSRSVVGDSRLLTLTFLTLETRTTSARTSLGGAMLSSTQVAPEGGLRAGGKE